MSASAESIGVHGAAAPAQLFVINLAASTSPMALSHPSSPELKRYTFFVSRQREEGRERFRLHMGYFSTQDEAEALLLSVRDVYPAAWAGPAPTTGMGRRGRIAPGSVVAAAPAAAIAAAPATAPATAPESVAASVTASIPVAAVPAMPASAASPATVDTAATGVLPKLAAVAAAPPPVRPAASPGPAASAMAPLDTMSNVRDVLAQLSESAADAPTVQMRMPPAPAAAPPATPASVPQAELSGADALSLLEMPAAPAPATVPAAVAAPIAAAKPAAATAPAAAAVPIAAAAPVAAAKPVAATAAAPQARAPAARELPQLANPFEGLENEPEVRLVTPEDTQTLTDIKIDRQNNAPPCFAVQLVWSVSPIDVATLPHLAIFEAYTLYNVEGNRQGRRWYGLRLGFFSDPNSATQVANYVRSDYKAVAVVPVAVKERDRAKGGGAPLGNAAGEPRKTSENELARDGMEGFELLADDRPTPARRDFDDAGKAAPVPAAAPKVAPRAALPAGAPQATGKPTGKRVVARRRPPPVPQGRTVSAGVGGAEVLESTLEILGASTLSLDEGRAIINDAAARKPADKKPSGNRFSRLLSRLGGG